MNISGILGKHVVHVCLCVFFYKVGPELSEIHKKVHNPKQIQNRWTEVRLPRHGNIILPSSTRGQVHVTGSHLSLLA